MGTRGERTRGYIEAIEARFSFVNPYWLLNFWPVTLATLGMSIGAVEHGWDWRLWLLAALCLWLGDEGLHRFDLADEDIKSGLDPTWEFRLGIVLTGAGGILGLLLAYLTTPWFLVIVVFGTVLGLAYNLEWFDGLLHDRQKLGPLNLGTTIGWVPTFGGYFLVAEQFSLGMAIFAIGPLLNLATLQWVEEDIKPVKNQTYGVESDRAEQPSFERLQRRVVQSNPITLLGFGFMAVGTVLLFAV